MSTAAYISYPGLQHLANVDTGKGIHWVTLPHEEIPIQIHSDPNHPGSLPPTTAMQVFDDVAKRFNERPALLVKRNGQWKTWTYGKYYQDTINFAKGLIHVGADMFQGVSILGFNCPEWVIGNMGSIYAGCLPAGIYTTNGPDACQYVAAHCGAAVILVENEEQLQKILQVRDRLPALKAIVQWSGNKPKNVPGLYGWQEFLSLGSKVDDMLLSERIRRVKPGNCCTLIYTSGTTGNPKAVMISHDNITWTAKVGIRVLFGEIDAAASPQRLVSYLPLSHIAAQITDIHGPLTIAATVFFAQPDALKGSLVETLSEVKPTQFLGVPRVWEKIEEKMRAVGAANTGVKKQIGDWAKTVGLEGSRAKLEGRDVPWGWTVANQLVFNNIKKALGLNESSLNITAAAPIALKTLEYFQSLDIPIYEVYGMSECTGPHTVNVPEACKVGTVGRALPGVENKLEGKDEKGNGEICMRGRHVFMGYLFNPEATMETIDAEGWLHSGDLGRVDEEGYLKITGRIKELLITAGGENVAPVLIEDTLKDELPALSNAVVIGDKKKFLSCLLTLKSEPDCEGRPTNQLAPATLSFLKSIRSNATTISEAIQDSKVHEAIDRIIGRANQRAISRAQYIRKWRLLEGDFTVDGGELTPTMKLKRRIVCDKYKSIIDGMYEDENQLSKL